MKLIYLLIFIVLIVIIFLGKSILSSASAVTNTVTTAASGIQLQSGGKKTSNLRILYLIFAITAVIFILANVNTYFS